MIEVWFDGVCEPRNPGGHAAYGLHIIKDGQVILSEGKYVGEGEGISNNVAEYRGFLKALTTLKAMNLQNERIIVRGDSKLVIEQMQDHWQIRQGAYVDVALHARKELRHFKYVTFEWIPREENTVCDKLGKDVLRVKGIRFKLQPEVI